MKTATRKSDGKAARQKTPPAPQSTPRVTTPECVLLAVTGMSPAILTETIWALANPADADAEPVIPSRIIVITTTQGRERLGDLFKPTQQLGGKSPWDSLRAALEEQGHDLTGHLRFGLTGDDVRVITAADPASSRTAELPDIRTRADNEAAADFILNQVRSIVGNPDTTLITTIAGGRKTMSALLYACMTLVARETDQLTHVLVSEPYEALRGFWFPAQPGGPIPRSGNSGSTGEKPLDPGAAKLELAFLPFVALNKLFERDLGRKAGTFSRLVESCRSNVRQQAAQRLSLTLDTARAEIEVNNHRFRLAPAEMLACWFLARRAKQGESALPAYKDALDLLNQFREDQRACEKDFNDWRHADSLKQSWDDRTLVKAVADLRERLRSAGGDASLLAACLPERGRCSLDLPGTHVQIVD